MSGVSRRTFSLAGVHGALPATTTDPQPLLLLPPSTPPSGSYDFARCRPCPLWAAVLLPATDSRIACVHLAPDTFTWSVQSRLKIYFFGDWFAVCPNPPLGVPPLGVVRLLVPFFTLHLHDHLSELFFEVIIAKNDMLIHWLANL